MIDFEFHFEDYKYGSFAVARKYRQKMNKNEEIEIKPMMNGYRVSYEYRELNPNKDEPRNWEYRSEEYMFKTWDEVVDFVAKSQLEVPPAKL